MGETWIATLLGTSYPELFSFGSTCIWISLCLVILGIFTWWRGNRRWAVGLGVGFAVLLVLAAVSIADPFCMSGYIAHDGICSWE
jgi:hypothetical protein